MLDSLDKVREALQLLVREVCDGVARDEKLLGMWPVRRVRIERSGGPDSTSFSLPEEVQKLPVLTTPGERHVSSLKAADAVVAQLANHPARPDLLPPTENRPPDFDEAAYLRQQFVVGFVKRYVARASGPAYDSSAFAEAFSELSAVLNERTVEERVLIPLFELAWSSDKDSIDLGHGVCLRRLAERERESMLSAGMASGPFSSHGPQMAMLVFVQAGVDARWRIPVHSPRLSPERLEPARDAVTALRLTGAGGFSAPGCYAESPLVRWYPTGRAYIPLPFRAISNFGPYVLSPERAAAVPEVFDGLRRLHGSDRQGIDLAIERFHRSFDVPRLEERVVDLMIALDCLLGSKGPGSVQRLSLRLPMYISNSRDERLHLSRLVNAAYAMRSAIVHGGSAAPLPGRHFAKTSSADFLGELEEAVRRVLRRSILDATSGKRPVADVPRFIDDDLILGAGDTRD